MANKLKSEKSKHSNEQFTGELPYTLTNDFFFKAFLQQNETALRGLLCALLSIKPEEITSITITNPISEGDAIDDKDMILDLKLVLNQKQLINLEMQVENLGNWPERSLTYLCRMFDHLKSGEDYIQVKKTLHISILNFTPNNFPPKLYLDYFLYNLKTMHKYSDKFGIYMLQLNQIGNPEDEKNMPEIYYWAKLFKATTWEEIRMLAKKNEAIHQSLVTIQELTADEKAKMKMEARERYRRDMAARFELGKQESEKMIQKLQAEKEQIEAEKNQIQAEKNQIQNEKEQLKVETAKNFFQNGVSIEIVQKSIPDLTPEEIQKIYEEVMNEKNETL